jgi:integrase
MSGFRDGEGRFTTWRDVDFRHSDGRVTARPHWGFRPKTWEEREVPMPERLITILQKYRPTGVSPDYRSFRARPMPRDTCKTALTSALCRGG